MKKYTTIIDWKEHLDSLIESESSVEWKPFPEKYLTIHADRPVITRQISTKYPSAHVIAKITEDFVSDTTTSSQDEESLPPRVFCWNDVSTLSMKVAFKTVKSGFELEYKKVIKNVTFDIRTFSSDKNSNLNKINNSSSSNLTAADDQPDYIIYHILDPSFSQSQVTAKVSKLVSSYSNNQITSSLKKTISFGASNLFADIDSSSIRQLGESIQGPAIFIFDCPNTGKLLNTLRSLDEEKDFFIFGATASGVLPFSANLPYDLFTSCLLTPAKVALLIQTRSYEDLSCGVLSPIDIQDLIMMLDNSSISDKILETLENALGQFADRIALEYLENNIPLFERIFRRDPLIADLFYHFLYACRVMQFVSTTPLSYPALPDMTKHPLWDTFDLQVDRALYSIKKNIEYFSLDKLLNEQMELLENWLTFPAANREMPDELSYLATLLKSDKYFERAIHFTSQFLSISADTTEKFLNTRAFPILVQKIPEFSDSYNNISAVIPNDEEILANFSFALAASILVSPDLRPSFDPYIKFWEEMLVTAKTENSIVSCLCCLLQFDKTDSLTDQLRNLLKSESCRVRTLSHLLLKKKNIPLDLPIKRVSDEADPLCRAALVSRIAESANNENKGELFYDLILSMGDPFSFVREEAIISLSNILIKEPASFFEAFSLYLERFNENEIRDPIVHLLSRELEILTYDPSIRVQKRYSEFLSYLNELIKSHQKNNFSEEKQINKEEVISKNVEPMKSSLLGYCLSTIVHYTTEADEECLPISHSPLSGKLIGTPAVSPSGLLSCGNSDGQIVCQTSKMTKNFDLFNQIADQYPQSFAPIFNGHLKRKSLLSYQKFIDDEKLLAVSDTSQVIVIDTHIDDEPSCSFLMDQPDTCTNIKSDYNIQTFHLLESSGKSAVSIFDLETQKKSVELRIDRDPISCLNWIKPFSSLFYLCQDNFYIFDERLNKSVQSAPLNKGDVVIGCNSANAMPLNIVIAKENGILSMIDLRTMGEVEKKSAGRVIRMFEVHRQLPFGFGLSDNTAFAVTFDSGALNVDFKEFSVPIHSFALHSNEAACVVRTLNRATYLDIKLE